jgi:hypothetical protein
MTFIKTPEYLKINRANKMFIKENINILGGSNFAGLLYHDFQSPNEASHHRNNNLKNIMSQTNLEAI